MKNKAPIILNCFSRGGSNIIWNFLLTHPDVCHPMEETLQIFQTGLIDPRIEGYKILWLEKNPIFSQWKFHNRESLNQNTMNYIDDVLHRLRQNNYFDDEMRFKDENDVYDQKEIDATRLVIKKVHSTSTVPVSSIISGLRTS